MEKNNQVKRIKELISEDTLYGKLVDREILNEQGGTKKVIDDLLGLVSKNPLLQKKSISLPKIEKDFISNISNAPNKIAKISDTKLFKNYLSGEVFDDLATQMKNKLEPLRGKEIGDIKDPKTNKPYTYDDIIDNVGKQIDLVAAELKEEGKYIDFAADDIDPLFKDVFPGISDAYKIAKKTSKLGNIFKSKSIFIKESLKDYFTRLFNFKEKENNVFYQIWTNQFDDNKERGVLGKWFKSLYELYGGKKSFWVLTGVQIAKGLIMIAYCDKTTGKVELDWDNPSNGDEVVEGERFTEQEEETAAGEAAEFISDIGVLGILKLIFLSPKHGGIHYLNKAAQKVGFEHIAFFDITEWSCDDIKGMKQNIESSKEAMENKEIIQQGVKDFQGYVKEEGEKLIGVVNDTIKTEASNQGIDVTDEEIEEYIFNTNR